VIFHYSLVSSRFEHPYIYIHIRAIVGGSISITYRFLLLYALWRKMADLFLISLIFLVAVILTRLTLDFYCYSSGYIKQSLYYPFDSFETKSMTEEIIDLVFALIQNCFVIVLSIYMFTDMVNDNRPSRSTKELYQPSSQSEQD
jgi:hypothetical protein